MDPGPRKSVVGPPEQRDCTTRPTAPAGHPRPAPGGAGGGARVSFGCVRPVLFVVQPHKDFTAVPAVSSGPRGASGSPLAHTRSALALAKASQARASHLALPRARPAPKRPLGHRASRKVFEKREVLIGFRGQKICEGVWRGAPGGLSAGPPPSRRWRARWDSRASVHLWSGQPDHAGARLTRVLPSFL